MIFAKQILKFKPMLCKYLRSSLKTVRRTVFPPYGVALSSNLSLTASQVKQKEQAEACSFCLAGVERFELPDDGVRVRSLTAWRHPNILFRPIDFASCTRRICFANASIHAAEHSKRAPQSTFLFYTLSFFFASVLIRFWKKFFISV